tara:strand:- start:52821 stop:53387 length:567 start_codon:yes stop_codon:yes gene_type:complete
VYYPEAEYLCERYINQSLPPSHSGRYVLNNLEKSFSYQKQQLNWQAAAVLGDLEAMYKAYLALQSKTEIFHDNPFVNMINQLCCVALFANQKLEDIKVAAAKEVNNWLAKLRTITPYTSPKLKRSNPNVASSKWLAGYLGLKTKSAGDMPAELKLHSTTIATCLYRLQLCLTSTTYRYSWFSSPETKM